jgi:hypothetical protein
MWCELCARYMNPNTNPERNTNIETSSIDRTSLLSKAMQVTMLDLAWDYAVAFR